MKEGELILVAGATGSLGRQVVRELQKRGYRVRLFARNSAKLEQLSGEATDIALGDAMKPETLQGVMTGVTRVFSCLGASVIPIPKYGRRTFTQVDTPANINLINIANAAGVRKFGYVSVLGAEKLPKQDFVVGHERVVDYLRASGLEYSIVRPAGFFQSMEQIVLQAGRGLLPEHNGGCAHTNPIHEADLARFVVDDLLSDKKSNEQDVGGPDVLTRKEISAIAESSLHKGNLLRVPVGVLRSAGWAIYPFNPRVGNLMSFISDILIDDFVGPCYGERHIADYFAERTAGRLNDQVQVF